MAVQYAYNFAHIDVTTGFCFEVLSTSDPAYAEMAGYVEIPECNTDYMGKYYLNGAWYEDAAGTIPWTPAE